MNIKYINERIKKEICLETIEQLKDANLLNEYKKCISVKNKINKFELLLTKYNIIEEIKNNIINDYLLDLIPPGPEEEINLII